VEKEEEVDLRESSFPVAGKKKKEEIRINGKKGHYLLFEGKNPTDG